MSTVRSFFERYAKALGGYDAEGIAAALAPTFLNSGSDHFLVVDNGSRFVEQLKQGLGLYRQFELDEARIVSYEETILDEEHVLVQVEWAYARSDGEELVRTDSTYVVRRFEDDWAIIFFVDHNEQERLAEAGLLPAEGS